MALIYSYPLADEVTNDSWVLGSEMDNGSRVVKNYSVGDLASFTRGFVTLNDVLDNDNVSQIDAKVGGIFLYNPNVASGLGYPYITGDKNRFNFYNNVDEYYGSLSQDTLSLVNVGDEYELSIMKPAAVTNNRTVTFQDADGIIALTSDIPAPQDLEQVLEVGNTATTGAFNTLTLAGSAVSILNPISNEGIALRRDSLRFYRNDILNEINYRMDLIPPFNLAANRTIEFPDADGTVALTDDLLDYVPYTGATQSIDLGNYDIFTAGNARLGDDGTVWGSSFQFGNNGSLQSAAQSSIAWVLPDESGTIALTKYKVYTALLTQSGTSAPVATVLENTIGAITIIRSGVGEYRIQSSGLFTLNKTTFDITPILGFIKQDQISNTNEITFITRDTSNITSDGLLASKKLEIRVYN